MRRIARRTIERWQRHGLTYGDVLGGLLGAGIAVGIVLWVYGSPVAWSQPTPLTGLAEDHLVASAEFRAEFPESFSVGDGQDNVNKTVKLYELAAGVAGGLDAGPQQTTDCVGWGWSAAAHVAQLSALAKGMVGEVVRPAPHVTWGLTRVHAGGGRPRCGAPGAYPVDAIKALKDFGYASAQESGIPYSRSAAERMGCKGVDRKLLEIAKPRAGTEVYPVRTTSEWRDAICNGYPVAVAFGPWNAGNVGRTYQQDGKWILKFNRSGDGGHQLCSLGYDRGKFMLWNSHGRSWPNNVKHTDGTPQGGVWIDETEAARIVDIGECYAVSAIGGFKPDELDLSIFDRLKLRSGGPK